MTRNRAGDSRLPNALMGEYYAQRASAGLLVTESADVSPQAIGYPGTPGLYEHEQVEGWRCVVQAVRAAQQAPAPFFCQLFHCGRVSHASFQPNRRPPIAPSAIRADVQLYTPEGMQPASMPQALAVDQIARVVSEYAAAAKAAIDAGFDGVEINGGNGYLVDQFLRDGTNRRTDDYGGPPRNRIRFALELVDAVSEVIGSSRVGFRVSPAKDTNGVFDSDPGTLFETLAAALNQRDLAYLHVIEDIRRATVTPKIRELFHGTLIGNDGYDRESAERAIDGGLVDIVSFARAFLANPDLPRRFALGASLNEPDPARFYAGTHEGYTTYPALTEGSP